MSSWNVSGKLFIMLFAAVWSASCDPWFAYSPYEARLDKAYHNTTEKNLALIRASDSDDRTFKVALLSDPHYHFRKLDQAIAHINAQGDYKFAIVAGDLSENGLKQEFVYFYESMTRLKIPYITVIGNHDYLSNGETIYGQMFGHNNYSFVVNNVKFVMFDNTTVESSREPDMQWLASTLKNDSGCDYVIPVSHIPPYDQQMKNHSQRFHELLAQNDIRLSVHGHRHDFSKEHVFGDGIDYLTVSSPQKRSYTELTISPQGLNIKKIEY